MQLKSMIFICLIFLIGCTSSTNQLDLSKVVLINASIEVNETEYSYPQISGLKDGETEKKANDTLKNEFLVIVNDEVTFGFKSFEEPEAISSEIIFLSQDFITIAMTHVYYGERVQTQKAYCTLNIHTGALLHLDEIINDLSAFNQMLYNGEYVYPYYQIENVDEITSEANLSNYDFFSNLNGRYSVNKKSFFLQDEMLCFQHAHPNADNEICIPIDFLSGYLIEADSDYSNKTRGRRPVTEPRSGHSAESAVAEIQLISPQNTPNAEQPQGNRIQLRHQLPKPRRLNPRCRAQSRALHDNRLAATSYPRCFSLF